MSRLFFCFTAYSAFAFAVSIADAQQFRSDPVNAENRLQLANTAKQAVKNPAAYQSSQDEVKKFFNGYYFPLMTQADPNELGQLGKRRDDFFRQFMWKSSSAALQSDLTTLTREYMQRVLVNPKYHPAVRYNAILMLGMLDAKYASESGGTRQPPQPLPEANQILVKVVSAAGKHPSITPPLVIGALVGLERHARYADALPKPNVAAMESALLSTLQQSKPYREMSSEVHQWMLEQAATAMAQLVGSANKGQNVQALLDTVANDKLELDTRCYVANLLNDLSLDGVPLQSDVAARPLVQLADDVGDHEAAAAKEYEDLQVGPMRGRVRPARRNRRINDEPEKFERRGLIARLGYLRSGLRALDPVAKDDAKTTIEGVLAAINPVYSAARDDKTLDLDLTKQVRMMARDIERLAEPWNADVAPAADEPAAATARGDSGLVR